MTKCNFAGDETAGKSWTDKIMANKTDNQNTVPTSAQGEAAEDDEWVRRWFKLFILKVIFQFLKFKI